MFCQSGHSGSASLLPLMRLNLSCILFQPLTLFFIQMWSDEFVNLLVVIIQKLLLFLGHQVWIDSIQVDRYECDRLKVHKLTIFILLSLAY